MKLLKQLAIKLYLTTDSGKEITYSNIKNKNHMKIVFEVKAAFEKKVRLTEERLNHTLFKHPELVNNIDKIKNTLISPDLIRKSQYNSNVFNSSSQII